MDVTLIARDAQGADLPDPRVFDNAEIPASESALADLRATVGGADLAAPPVVLPDFHHKSNMELPSSVAVATRNSIRPTLTSASVNCGMALIALDSERPGQAGLEEFYRREGYPHAQVTVAVARSPAALKSASLLALQTDDLEATLGVALKVREDLERVRAEGVLAGA